MPEQAANGDKDRWLLDYLSPVDQTDDMIDEEGARASSDRPSNSTGPFGSASQQPQCLCPPGKCSLYLMGLLDASQTLANTEFSTISPDRSTWSARSAWSARSHCK